MRKFILLFIIAFCSSPAHALKYYQHEVNALRDRQRDYVKIAANKNKALIIIDHQWKSIANRSEQLTSDAKAAFSQKVDSKNLIQLAQFKSTMEYLQLNIDIAEIGYRSSFSIAESALESGGFDSETAVHQKHQEAKDGTFENLKELRVKVTDAIQQTDQAIEVWAALEREKAVRKEISKAEMLQHQILFRRNLTNFETAFYILEQDFHSALRFKRFSEADGLLTSFIWLKNTMPLYFRGKTRTTKQSELLKNMVDKIAAMEKAMTGHFLEKKARTKLTFIPMPGPQILFSTLIFRSLKTWAETESCNCSEKDSDIKGGEGENSSSKDDVAGWEIPDNDIEGGSSTERDIIVHGGEQHDIWDSPEVEKGYHESMYIDGQYVGKAFETESDNQVADHEQVYDGDELANKVNQDLDQSIAGQDSSGAAALTEKPLADQTRHIQDMVDRVQGRSNIKQTQAEELITVQSELTRFQLMQQHFNSLMQGSLANVLGSQTSHTQGLGWF